MRLYMPDDILQFGDFRAFYHMCDNNLFLLACSDARPAYCIPCIY